MRRTLRFFVVSATCTGCVFAGGVIGYYLAEPHRPDDTIPPAEVAGAFAGGWVGLLVGACVAAFFTAVDVALAAAALAYLVVVAVGAAIDGHDVLVPGALFSVLAAAAAIVGVAAGRFLRRVYARERTD